MSKEQQFKYERAEISADRLGDFVFDVRQLIVELVFFEAIDKPFMTGQIAISDDQGTFDGLNFSGTERLHITMLSDNAKEKNPTQKTGETPPTQQGKKTGEVMSRSFILTHIDTIVKSSNSGQSSIYVFGFIDEHAVVSKTRLISRSIKNDLPLEIKKLCQNELGKDMDLSYLSTPAQSGFKGIIPYMHPLEAASWLTKKCTTISGMPYFLYASMHDERLRFASLDVLLQQPAWNADIPFIFSPANTQAQEENGDPTLQYFQVQSMKVTQIQNTMKQLSNGGIGSRYTVTDLSTGKSTSQHFNFYNSLVSADKQGLIDITKQNVLDWQYQTPAVELVNIESTSMQDADAEIMHSVVSRGVYGENKSLHDEVSKEMYLKKIESMAYRQALGKNAYDVTVPGPGFIKSGGTVGDKIRIHVLSDNNDPETPSPLDRIRSGDFLIMNTRHTFKDTRHDVAMTVVKLERGPSS